MLTRWPMLGVALACMAGCQIEGDVAVRAYGEAFIEEGIAADEMADGWRVQFERFEVRFGDISLDGNSFGETEPLDLTSPSDGTGQLLTTAAFVAGEYVDPGFEITNIDVVGSATKEGVTKRFDWTFDVPTSYTQCEAMLLVEVDETASFEATIHADHLFYDSLVAEEPNVVFGGIADADADDDGQVTVAELASTGLGAYDGGSLGDVTDLWSYLVAQSRTLGHINGEGHCDVVQ